MRRPPQNKSIKLSQESLRLVNLAVAVSQSASRIEDEAWQKQLDALVKKNLKGHHALLDSAAEHVFKHHPEAYEVMIETLESLSTSQAFEYHDQWFDALLITAPILAWTRFEIAAGQISPDNAQFLATQLQDCLLTPQARLHLLPTLYSLDQLPRNHSETAVLLEQLAQAELKGMPPQHSQDLLPVIPFLADIRFMLAVVLVPKGQALFQWQEIAAPFDCAQAKTIALDRWTERVTPTLNRLLPGCHIDLLMPEAFYTACREADIKIRPALIRSAVFYLTQNLNVEASEIHTVVAGFGDEDAPGQVDEYRISFLLKSVPEVLYGVVWPLYQPDDQINAIDSASDNVCVGEIPAILNDCGVLDIRKMDDLFSMEFCDDCHAPLFPDEDGDLVHAEMPADTPEQGSEHFH
ncbi:DUF2863 family protein [Undibacterium sp. Jales W-56]|uniref:DUF2863 family protein n=1 Tax=Undibacterium sp. Jales W-56 TaxID=2897325 RepID=UPI0021D22437|nr:DUF2863 family protein [Undibacterium sp. Jales W-56]MCU6435185.1 DUF2863 family protein [Undibacterium sp. Jales W-56]